MPRNPAVTATMVFSVIGLLLLACAPLVAHLTRPEPGTPGVNMAPWMVVSLFGAISLLLAGATAVLGALVSMRGPRADLVGCLVVAGAVATALLSPFLASTAGDGLEPWLAGAIMILAGLVLLSGLIVLAARPGARQPHHLDQPGADSPSR